MDLTELKCQYEDCGLILEKPVTLLCGKTLCKEHLDDFETKLKSDQMIKKLKIKEQECKLNLTNDVVSTCDFRMSPTLRNNYI